jgi:hypothetical protein
MLNAKFKYSKYDMTLGLSWPQAHPIVSRPSVLAPANLVTEVNHCAWNRHFNNRIEIQANVTDTSGYREKWKTD